MLGDSSNKWLLDVVKLDFRTAYLMIQFYCEEFGKRDEVLSKLTKKQQTLYRLV